MNLPNYLTLARIALTFVMIYFLFQNGPASKIIAFTVFLIASLTDILDGYLARLHNTITPLGKILDPIADKLLMFGAFISFVELGIVPAWMVIVMLAREIFVTGFRLAVASKGVALPALRSGKHKTLMQFISIISIFLWLILRELPQWQSSWNEGVWSGIQIILLWTIVLTIYSGIKFLMAHRKALS